MILSTKYVFEFNGDYSNAGVAIKFKRRVEYHILNTFLQTVILILVGFLSFFFDVDNFSDRIMVTLTTMLVLATLSASILEVSR